MKGKRAHQFEQEKRNEKKTDSGRKQIVEIVRTYRMIAARYIMKNKLGTKQPSLDYIQYSKKNIKKTPR